MEEDKTVLRILGTGKDGWTTHVLILLIGCVRRLCSEIIIVTQHQFCVVLVYSYMKGVLTCGGLCVCFALTATTFYTVCTVDIISQFILIFYII